MKKKYIKPVAATVEVQNCSIICQSPGDPVRATQGNADLDDDVISDDGYEGVIR